MMKTGASLSFQNVTCPRADRILFEGMDFALQPGEAALIAGPNGAGKSSLIRMAAGLLQPAAGHIQRRGRLAMSYETLALDMDKPLHRALDFWAGIDGSDSKAVGEALSALSLSHLADVPARMLSTGQRKRAMLARVVAAKAPIWLLDEPANGLDAASLQLLGGLMQIHLASGGILLAASHQPLPLIFSHRIDLGTAAA
jgi:heme exporter protein A